MHKRAILLSFFLISGCLVIISSLKAQDISEEEAVRRVVERLFEGMRQGDSAMVHSTMMNEVQLYTAARNKKGEPILHQGSLQSFLNAVGTPHDEIWDEPIWDTEIRVEGHLAQAWTKYAFYLGKQFSHCGVDAFHLFKTENGWKIFHLTDTRKKEGCDIPDDIINSKK